MLPEIARQWIDSGAGAAALLVYLRIQALLVAMPVIGTRYLSVRVKVSLAMALTPMFAGSHVVAAAPAMLIVHAGGEMLTGLATGLLIRMVAASLDTAAAAMAQSASLSQLVGVADEHSPHPLGNMLNLAGLAVLMAMGLPLVLCQLLADSFSLHPPGHLPQIAAMWRSALAVVRDGFVLALMLASPLLLGGLLFQALSGVVARVMPALPVTFIAAPLAVLLALMALSVLAPVTLRLWADHVLALPIGALP